MEITFLSDERPLVAAQIAGHSVVALLDTGASVSMVDRTLVRLWKLKRSGRTVRVVGMTGREVECDILDVPVVIGGHSVWQCVASDLTGVAASIQRETGYAIGCIIGYKAMRRAGIALEGVKD